MSRHESAATLRQQAAWVVGCRIVGIFATLASNIMAARLLGPAGFGVYVLVTTMIAFGGILGMAGLNEAGLRFVSERLSALQGGAASAYLRRVFQVLLVTSLLSAIAMAASMMVYFLIAGQSPRPWIILFTSLGVAVLAIQQVTAEMLRGYADLRGASLFSGGQTGGPLSNLVLLTGLGIAMLTVGELSPLSAVTLTVASICVTAPVAIWMIVRISHRSANHTGEPASHCHLSQAEHRQLLSVAIILMLNQLLAFASQQLDIWMGGALLPTAELGLYSAAKRSLLLAAMPIQMAMMTILPSIPRLHSKGQAKRLQQLVRSTASIAAVPSIAALVALAMFPGPILRIIFGGEYSGAAPTVIVLCAGYLVLALLGNATAVLTMTDHYRAVLMVNLLAAVVLLAVGSLGAYWYGTVGLAVGSSASMAFQNGVLWWLTRKCIGVWTHVGKPQFDGIFPTDVVAYP